MQVLSVQWEPISSYRPAKGSKAAAHLMLWSFHQYVPVCSRNNFFMGSNLTVRSSWVNMPRKWKSGCFQSGRTHTTLSPPTEKAVKLECPLMHCSFNQTSSLCTVSMRKNTKAPLLFMMQPASYQGCFANPCCQSQ